MTLISLSAHEMRKGLLSKEFSAVELATAHLKRIKETNEALNSFITITEDLALNQAKAADKQLAEKKEQTPLLTGIPVAIKDNLTCKDTETTAASKILKGFVAPYTCTAVKRLTDKGAVVVGKANLDEFAMGSSTENSAFGPAKNPWNTDFVPGGSSGGSCVAVASGQAALSLGTDTGGSIRLPASYCGNFGMKPTYGRVSRYGAIAYASSLDQIGPFARTVDDLALTLQTISGQDPNDSTSMDIDVPNFLEELLSKRDKGLAGLRVGVPKEFFVSGINPDVEKSVRDAIKTLGKLGAEIIEISLPNAEYALAVYYIVALAEASSNLARYDGVRYGFRVEKPGTLHELYEKTRALGFGKEVKRRIMLGTYVLSAGYYDAYYLKAQKVRTLVLNDFKKAFSEKCDVIASPVSPSPVFKFGEKTENPLEMYLADIFTVPVNLAGLPGISVPCGSDSRGLPVGLQLIGSHFEEGVLLRVADAFSREVQFDTAKMAKENTL